MQRTELTRLALSTLPPLHLWPRPLKRAIMVAAYLACGLTYLLLFAGLIGLVLMVVGSR